LARENGALPHNKDSDARILGRGFTNGDNLDTVWLTRFDKLQLSRYSGLCYIATRGLVRRRYADISNVMYNVEKAT
jgi:hypothetical protein